MHRTGTGRAGTRLLRPLARAADGIAHNRERRRVIHRYRRIDRVTLVPEDYSERNGQGDEILAR